MNYQKTLRNILIHLSNFLGFSNLLLFYVFPFVFGLYLFPQRYFSRISGGHRGKLLNSLCADQWSRIGCVVNVPKDDGSYLCEVRIGVYGGGPGQMRFRNPLFRKAQVELQADINGTGWTELQVGKATPESIKLDPSLEHQSVSFVLPKAKFIYRVELIGNHGQKIIREFTND